MKVFILLMILNITNLSAQKNYPIKWEGQIDGIFEVVKIDTLKKEYHIWLKMNYLANREKYSSNVIPENYYALLISFEKKENKNIDNWKQRELKIGTEYYFDLKHYYFYKSLHPAPNTYPYAYGEWPNYIWKEESDFGLYESKQVINNLYLE